MDKQALMRHLDDVAGDRQRLYAGLRGLPADLVGELMLSVPDEFPALRAALPRMATDQVQTSWTGGAGSALLLQTCAVVRALALGYQRAAGKPLDNPVLLDYGCGWGRMIRLMYAFADPSRIHGCDPWDQSLALCRESGLPGRFAQSDYLPAALPFGDTRFDFIYAFSVFTHLSERAALAALAACRRSIRDDGVLAVSVRPSSYWDFHDQAQSQVDRARMKRDHARLGFAFTPHHRPPIDGDITYGDTSISEQYIRSRWTDWTLVGYDYLLQDPFQTLVFLRPA